VEEPELAGLDPFVLLAGEATRIDQFYQGLTEADWHAPTRCAGWDRRDLLAHLAGVEDYTAAGLRGAVQELFATSGAGGLDEFNEWSIRRRADLSTDALLDEWRQLVSTNDATLAKRAGGGMDTSVGAYPVDRQAFYLACERAIHADDAGVPVTAEEAERRQDWRLRFARVAVTESRRQGGVTVVADRGAQVVSLDGQEVRLPDEQFVAAVSGRLPPAADIPHRLRQALAVLG
jgi:uncharacterized protein (TIGR03083 family)